MEYENQVRSHTALETSFTSVPSPSSTIEMAENTSAIRDELRERARVIQVLTTLCGPRVMKKTPVSNLPNPPTLLSLALRHCSHPALLASALPVNTASSPLPWSVPTSFPSGGDYSPFPKSPAVSVWIFRSQFKRCLLKTFWGDGDVLNLFSGVYSAVSNSPNSSKRTLSMGYSR